MMCNNMSLTTQLSDGMNININMAKKLYLKTTYNPEDKRLSDKANRKAVIEKNLDSNYYF